MARRGSEADWYYIGGSDLVSTAVQTAAPQPAAPAPAAPPELPGAPPPVLPPLGLGAAVAAAAVGVGGWLAWRWAVRGATEEAPEKGGAPVPVESPVVTSVSGPQLVPRPVPEAPLLSPLPWLQVPLQAPPPPPDTVCALAPAALPLDAQAAPSAPPAPPVAPQQRPGFGVRALAVAAGGALVLATCVGLRVAAADRRLATRLTHASLRLPHVAPGQPSRTAARSLAGLHGGLARFRAEAALEASARESLVPAAALRRLAAWQRFEGADAPALGEAAEELRRAAALGAASARFRGEAARLLVLLEAPSAEGRRGGEGELEDLDALLEPLLQEAAHGVGADAEALRAEPAGAYAEARAAATALSQRRRAEEQRAREAAESVCRSPLVCGLLEGRWAWLAAGHQLSASSLERALLDEEEAAAACAGLTPRALRQRAPGLRRAAEERLPEACRRFRAAASRLSAAYGDVLLPAAEAFRGSSRRPRGGRPSQGRPEAAAAAAAAQRQVLGVLAARGCTTEELEAKVREDLERWLEDDSVLQQSAGAAAGPEADTVLGRLRADLGHYHDVSARHERLSRRAAMDFEDFLREDEAAARSLAFRSSVQPDRLYMDFMERHQALVSKCGFQEAELQQNITVQKAWARHALLRERLARARRRFEGIFQNELELKSGQSLHDFVALLRQAPAKVAQYEHEFPDVPLQAFKVELDNFKRKMAEAYNTRQRELWLLTCAMQHWQHWVRSLLQEPESFMAKLGFRQWKLEQAYNLEVEQFFKRYHHCPDMNWSTWERCELHLLIRHALDTLLQSTRLCNRLRLTDSLSTHPNWQPEAWQQQLEELVSTVEQVAQLEVDKSTLDKQLAS